MPISLANFKFWLSGSNSILAINSPYWISSSVVVTLPFSSRTSLPLSSRTFLETVPFCNVNDVLEISPT